MATTTGSPRAAGTIRTTGRPGRSRVGGHGRAINLFYLPAIALFLAFTVYPFIRGIGLSFQKWDGFSPVMTFTGLANYTHLLSDPVFLTALINTLIFGIGSTAIQQALGLGVAVALDRRLRGRNVARAIIYLPVLVSPVIMGTMYYLIFDYDSGTINDIIVALGGHHTAFFSNAAAGVAIIVLVNSLQFVGVSMVIYLAGLQSIPGELKEAAMLDGAKGWRHFASITLPLLQPAFATSIVLNLIGGLKLFDVIEVLTGGGPGYATNSVSTLIGVEYFNNQTAGYASAMGVVLFIIIMVLTLALNTTLNRNRLES